MTRAFILAALVLCARGSHAQQQPAPARDEMLRAQLLIRGQKDQEVRQPFLTGRADSAAIDRMNQVDALNTTWMKQLVAERGWPGYSLVGRDGEQAAFLILQHATQDTAFMARTLPLLERAYATGEAEGQQVALLTDRVARQRGQAQIYGTQASIVSGRFVLDPIADSANVDKRRAQLGIPPVAAYKRLLDSLYSSATRAP
ncbi:MAG: hypothetical protein HOQ11_07580 [Gemmatimonadaceae bacterium]|nr:hypothetical protein [Gemmatimonadaceae bacterium]NUQ91915.1 hypothetical protein [Gemmatimonadaceae bacterium]NUR21018.1 hypothetical protein [Gemmatimonadaceae bacterium]NUS97252.1 hypothetical protein [Gemmatimonadaceae bacterium]